MSIVKPDTLFRFFDCFGGIETIKNSKLRFKKASEFNDPYDLQPRSFFPFIDIKKLSDDELINEFLSIERPPFCYLNKTEIINELSSKSLSPLFEEIEATVNVYVKSARALFDFYRNGNSILCLTEKIDDVKMWGDYAERGKGIAIEFKIDYINDNIFVLAEKVKYHECVPRFYSSYAELINSSYENSKEESWNTMFDFFSYSKTEHWKEEEEWRILYPDLSELPYHDFKIVKDDIKAIYLGYAHENKEETINIIREKFGDIDIYISDIRENEYGIIFTKVV